MADNSRVRRDSDRSIDSTKMDANTEYAAFYRCTDERMYARYGSMNDLSSMFESNNESNNDNECCTSTPSHGGVPTSFETSPDRRRQASTQAFHPDAVGRVTSNTSVNTSKRERSLSGDLVPPAAAAAAAKRPSSEHACLHGLFDCRASCAACVDEAAALVDAALGGRYDTETFMHGRMSVVWSTAEGAKSVQVVRAKLPSQIHLLLEMCYPASQGALCLHALSTHADVFWSAVLLFDTVGACGSQRLDTFLAAAHDDRTRAAC